MTTRTVLAGEAPLNLLDLLAKGYSLSLLWDLVDPDGPASEDLFKHEG